MTTAERLTKLGALLADGKSSIASAYGALEEKGATLPETQNAANLADTVASVPTGGGSTMSARELLASVEIGEDESVIYIACDGHGAGLDAYYLCMAWSTSAGRVRVERGRIENSVFVADQTEYSASLQTYTDVYPDSDDYVVYRISAENEGAYIKDQIFGKSVQVGDVAATSRDMAIAAIRYGATRPTSISGGYNLAGNLPLAKGFDMSMMKANGVKVNGQALQNSTNIGYVVFPSGCILKSAYYLFAANTLKVVDMSMVDMSATERFANFAYNNRHLQEISLSSTLANNTVLTSTLMAGWLSGCGRVRAIHNCCVPCSFSISWSTQYSEAALVEILEALPTVEGQTLTMGATNLAKLTSDEKAIATAKGWTLA